MQISGKNHIGSSLQAIGKTSFHTFNPTKGIENPTVFYQATEEEVEKAIQLANKAFAPYRKLPNQKRATFLREICKEIDQIEEQLLACYCMESGLSKERAKIEKTRTLFQLETFAQVLDTKAWRNTKTDKILIDGKEIALTKTNIPIGPIVVFGASNFPLAYSTAGGDTSSALAVGCPVIVKSHPMHAGTGELVAGAIIRAAETTNMPEGVFSNLNSKNYTVGAQLVQHPCIKGVGFTGSIKGGRAIFDLAAKRPEPIPVFAEMGSVNPVIISTSALAERGSQIAASLGNSICAGAGQFCTNPGLIFLEEGNQVTPFIEALEQVLLSHPAQTMLHPAIKKAYSEKLKHNQNTIGVQTLDTLKVQEEGLCATAQLLQTTGAVFLQNPSLKEEVFGMHTLIVRCKDQEQIHSCIATLEGQLTATLIAEEKEFAQYTTLVTILEQKVGRIIFNGVPTGVSVCDAMTHGGPYPASTDARYTAVGADAIYRWLRPVSYQNVPKEFLPQ